jgi:predicted Zn-dependent peptidase
MTSTLLPSDSQPRLHTPTIHRLENGLTIIAEQIPVDAVNLNVWVKVGSAAESNAINGMAHFLEHMIFKGTATLPSGEFERRVEERGAVINAATSQDYTHYYLTTAPQDFAELAPLQLEVVLNAAIPEDSFERERQVVLEEIRRSHDNPRRRTFHRAMELTFQQLPYRRYVLGPEAVIENLTAQQMRHFHAQWYQPRSITTAVVGNLPVEELIQIVEDSFNQAWAARVANSVVTQPIAQTPTSEFHSFAPEVPFTEIVRREFVDETLQQARLVMTWRVPGMVDLADTYELDVLASVLGHGRTSRLVQDLREQRGLVSSISVSNMTYMHQGVFYIAAQLTTENLEIVEQAIAHHISALQTELVTSFELERVRTRVANHFIFGNETPSDRSGLYGYYQTLVGNLEAAIQYPSYIQTITPTQLQTAAKKFLAPDAYGVVVIKPIDRN